MTNNIMSFTEIKKYPLFYLSDMLENPSNSFLLYQYGPYLLMRESEKSKILANDIKLLYVKNPIIAFMIDMTEILKSVNSKDTIGNVKEQILNVILRLPHHLDEYTSKTKEIGYEIIKNIQDIQYNNKTLESAILNYSPIVPYSGTIKKSDIQTTDLIELNYNELDFLIKSYLKDNIIDILLHKEDFISVDTYNSDYMLKENESINIDLSYDIMKLYQDNSSIPKSVKIYFTLVYLRYVIPEDKFHDALKTLIKINTTYNKIIKGEEVNVMEAVETFSKLSLPPDSSLY